MKLEERINYKTTGIYKIINLINNKIYIGQAKNICERIYGHLHSSVCQTTKDYNYPLHKAFRKYGIDNFEFEILEYCKATELNTCEQYWIARYKSNLNGYNQTAGGYQSIRTIKLTRESIEQIIALLLANKSNKEIANKFNVSADAIHKINVGKMWHDPAIDYPIRKAKPLLTKYAFNGTAVQQIDPQLNRVLVTYVSAEQASRFLGISGINIGRCCKGLRKTAGGYIWKKIEISETDWLALFK